MFLAASVSLASSAHGPQDDAQASLDETQWFRAEEHVPEIRDFLARAAATISRSVSLLDLFGASGPGCGKIMVCWLRSLTSKLTCGMTLPAVLVGFPWPRKV